MNTSIIENGYLELIIGPMFSGKTSQLVNIYKQYTFCNIPVCVINHDIDTRYHEEMLSTHDKIMIPCIQTYKLNDIWNCPQDENNPFYENYLKLRNADVILINEAQFFKDLKYVVKIHFA
jgi:thymidine kinase